MNITFRSVAALAGLALIATAVALSLASDKAEGADPGNVDIYAVDTDATGNTASAIGTVEGCRDGLADGSTFDIDIFVRGVNVADGISGASFNLVYDPAVLQINARAPAASHMFYQAAPLGTYFDAFSEPLPDTTSVELPAPGDYRHEGAEISGTAESGDGVVARLTIEVISAGVSTLDLTDNIELNDPNVLAFSGAPLQVLQVGDGEIHADGTTCGAATESPTPGQGATSTPTLIPTNSPNATATPQFATPTQSAAPGGGGSANTCNTVMAAATAGATTIAVLKPAGCNAGDTIRIGSGSTQEDAKIASVNGNIIVLVAPLTKSHAQGETVVEVTVTSAGGATTAAATPRAQPATGSGSDGGLSTVLLIALTLGGIGLLAVAGGSLLLARARHEE